MKQPNLLTCTITLALSVWACSTETLDTPEPKPSNRAGSDSGAGTSSVAGSTSSSSGSNSGPSGGTSAQGGSTATTAGSATGGATAGTTGGAQKPLPLPFFVNSPGNFVKSGFMGDAATSVVAAPSAADSDGTCGAKRASSTAGGDCDTFTITPAAAGMSWQGVFYQFPSGNWGDLPGRTVAAGAKTVTFSVRASRAIAVQFQVGMCDAAHPDDEMTCADGFFAFPSDADAAHKLDVTSEWTEHSISLSGVDYAGGVRGAFSWVIVNDDLLGDLTPLSLYVDNITWE